MNLQKALSLAITMLAFFVLLTSSAFSQDTLDSVEPANAEEFVTEPIGNEIMTAPALPEEPLVQPTAAEATPALEATAEAEEEESGPSISPSVTMLYGYNKGNYLRVVPALGVGYNFISDTGKKFSMSVAYSFDYFEFLTEGKRLSGVTSTDQLRWFDHMVEPALSIDVTTLLSVTLEGSAEWFRTNVAEQESGFYDEYVLKPYLTWKPLEKTSIKFPYYKLTVNHGIHNPVSAPGGGFVGGDVGDFLDDRSPYSYWTVGAGSAFAPTATAASSYPTTIIHHQWGVEAEHGFADHYAPTLKGRYLIGTSTSNNADEEILYHHEIVADLKENLWKDASAHFEYKIQIQEFANALSTDSLYYKETIPHVITFELSQTINKYLSAKGRYRIVYTNSNTGDDGPWHRFYLSLTAAI